MVKLPHLVGHRYEALSTAIGPEGAFAEEGKVAAGALTRFGQHDALRTRMTHGVFTVTLDGRGRWYLIVRVLAFRSGRESRDLFVMEEGEAADIVSLIEKDASRLRSALGQLRKSLLTR